MKGEREDFRRREGWARRKARPARTSREETGPSHRAAFNGGYMGVNLVANHGIGRGKNRETNARTQFVFLLVLCCILTLP